MKEVIYFSDKHSQKPETIASKRMLEMAGIKYRQFVPSKAQITIDFDFINKLLDLLVWNRGDFSFSFVLFNSWDLITNLILKTTYKTWILCKFLIL